LSIDEKPRKSRQGSAIKDMEEDDYPRDRSYSIINDKAFDTSNFYNILENMKSGNYGKNITDKDLLGESADFNQSLGMLSNLDDMKITL